MIEREKRKVIGLPRTGRTLSSFSAMQKKPLYSLRKTSFWSQGENHVRNPYKTCRLMLPFQSFSQKPPQEAWKTIRITVFLGSVCATPKIIVFPRENRPPRYHTKSCPQPLKNRSILGPFGVIFAKTASKGMENHQDYCISLMRSHHLRKPCIP